MRYNTSLLVAGLLAASPAFAIDLKAETQTEAKAKWETPDYVAPEVSPVEHHTGYVEHHEGHVHADFVPQDFDHEVAAFDHNDQIFDQHQYEETVTSQAEMLVALEAMKKELETITLSIANIETTIYGNSHDTFDNFDEIDANMLEVGQNRHTYGGLLVRVHDLADKCRWFQSELYYNRDVLLLYCQQFAYAPEMVPACAPILSC